jgi:mRNA-degrading endonuclease RelE of RelBE toxin-antitoxin system
MNDEITNAFDKFYKNVLGQVGEKTKEAIQEEVDNFSEKFERDIINAIPKKTGGLANSLTKVKQARVEWYGYNFEFKGNDKNGVPYEKIANTLNYGRQAGVSKLTGRKYPTITPKRFIEKAVRKLKKLDPAINDNFESKMQELNKK